MKKFLAFLTVIFLTATLSANNISISNLSLTGKNTGSHYILVQFDFSWENSWRTSSVPNNWDAAWVFVKYRVAGGAWQHAWLNETGHTAPSGSTVASGLLNPSLAFNATTNPCLGAFIYRSAEGTGTFSKTGVQLRWNYGANGVADNASVDLQVFAIEMVYVPAGSFAAGSGGSETSAFTLTTINTPNATVTPFGTGTLGGTGGGYPTGQTTPSSDSWPNGYNPFYCMKYEISQQQYVDFLNTLTQTQATARKLDKPTPNYRYEITGTAVGSYATTNPYVACNYLSWMDGAAYTDWAGLRPMTELEFEKACRGTATPVANEYAWGNSSATQVDGLANSGLINESASNSGANANYANRSEGPMRVGAFATASTTRTNAGSTYYGIMEMSGNLWERAVTVDNATGRAFTGLHGNGTLSTAGYADLSTWPGYITSEVTGETGSGFRGGSWGDDVRLYVSDRYSASESGFVRSPNHGFRAVRTKPLAIGDAYEGGIIAYILKSGDPGYDANMQKGLIAATADQSTGIIWAIAAYQGTNLTGTSTALGTGSANTDKIIAQNGAGSTYAAGLARAHNGGGYSDWYLPSKDEVYKLYLNNSAIGGFDNSYQWNFYWSSSQYNNSAASTQKINGDQQGASQKNGSYYVRAVRSFPSMPTLTTAAVTNAYGSTASGGGEVTGTGDFAVTDRGVCWSTSVCPTIADSKTSNGSGTGSFTSLITGLTVGVNYYVRAYATSSAGTAYGNQLSFTTTACFTAGTKIALSDGSFKNIEEIVVGDKVRSVNQKTMETVDRVVTRKLTNPPSNQLLKITFSNGTVNTNTKIHPYYVKGKGWSSVDPSTFMGKEGFSAVPLAVGDACQVLENGKLVTVSITSIEMLPNLVVPTYNFTVEETNCYFANGILVHNK